MRGAQVKEGKVIAVGPGRRANNGELIAPGVKEGDHVLMPDYGGQEVDLNGTKCDAHPRLLTYQRVHPSILPQLSRHMQVSCA